MALPETMQAWKKTMDSHEPIRSTVPVPKPGPDYILMRVLAMGVCHSDCSIMALKEPIPGMRKDFILGHEGAGEVVELGSNVDPSSFAVGDKVAVLIIPGCDKPTCPDCSRGWHRICKDADSGNSGLGWDEGFFAEYVAVKARAAVKVPEGVHITAAAVAPDAVLTAYGALHHREPVTHDQTIAILGLGGLGMNALQLAIRAAPKRILVVDKRQETLDAAVKLGVAPEDTFCTGNPDAKKIEEVVAMNGILIDTIYDFVGHESTIMTAQLAVRQAGTIVISGLFSQHAPLIVVLNVLKAVTIKFNYSGRADGLAECLDLIEQGVITPNIETGSVEDLPRVLRDLDDGKIKSRMVLLPDWKKQ